MKRKIIAATTGVVICTIGILVFIHYNNDHIEFENITINTIDENGEKISTRKHLCKEKYSF